jgi:hypothetical protein
MSTLGDMAKAEAMYNNVPKKKLVGCFFDPSGFVGEDGEQDTSALCDEMSHGLCTDERLWLAKSRSNRSEG